MSFLEQTPSFTTKKIHSHDEFVVASHPAQAQLPGPAQVKVYKTACSDKMSQLNKFTYVHNGHEGQMFHQRLARNVNLRGILFMTRAFFSIVTAAAAAIARVLFVRPAGIIIFGRGFWRRNVLSSLLFFN
jgi:hypothetical protein